MSIIPYDHRLVHGPQDAACRLPVAYPSERQQPWGLLIRSVSPIHKGSAVYPYYSMSP